jgi:hypothetical protein
MLIPEKLLGFLRREALNHTQSIARVALYVNRFHAACPGLKRLCEFGCPILGLRGWVLGSSFFSCPRVRVSKLVPYKYPLTVGK